ncbi:MAG: right-handed parallel beta-helix repeat-containing protein, partial [Planctomycetes bacterium]|nr:right-handed parallel beta-helix repeat-containing protein [Planctomycetota bacterium]
STPLELDGSKDLWGFRIEDTSPSLQNNARGLAVMAATASRGEGAGGSNELPVADAGENQLVTDDDDSGSETVTLDGSGSSDSDGTIVSYVWAEGGSPIASGETASVSLGVGTHTITLTVTDDDDATDSDTVTVTVQGYTNVAPVADAGSNQTVTDSDSSGSELVTLDGSGSSDADGTIVSYVWKEGANQIATGETVQVSLTAGSHTITLEVTDDDSATDDDTVEIKINVLPVADAGTDQWLWDLEPTGSEDVVLDGSGSLDSDGSIVSYVWKEGANQVGTGESPVVSLSVGTHTLTLVVTDNDGATDDDTVNIRIGGRPTADAGSDQQVTDNDETGSETVTLDGSGSSDSDGTIVSYVWMENEEAIASGQTAEVSLSVRLHEITLVVTDNEGGTDSDVVNVRVYAAPPPVCLDLSDGFNLDAWCGPLEMQAVYTDGSYDLRELQGTREADGVGWGVVSGGYLLVGGSTEEGYGETYSIEGQWFHPRYVSGTEGTPEDGVITGGDGRFYHLPSTLGNSVYSGDLLEVADPGSSWDIQPNVVVVGSNHYTSDWQVAEVEIELPSGQKGKYTDVNFVLAAMDTADRARSMRIVALYGSTGTDEEVLYSFSTEDGGSGPKVLEQSGGTDFDIVYTFSKVYSNDSGTTGSVSSVSGSLYEFSTPFELDDEKDLWGFRIEDTTPTLLFNARGLAVFAASATSIDTQGFNLPPMADAGSDDEVEDTDNNSYETVTLDGSGSSDSDGDIASWVWKEGETQIATGESPQVTFGVGTHEVTLIVTDNEEETASDTVTITVNASSGFHTYYVDFDAGSDMNNGLSTLTPWQHCPGDSNATGTPASTTLYYGDKVIFKGGVIYRGLVACQWSGTSGNPIVYDGNTAETWGTGRAILDGSEELTGWTQCTSAEDCDGNPNYANIYYTYAPSGVDAFNANLIEDNEWLHLAQHPNISDPFYSDNLDDYLTFDSATDTTIVDADYFTMQDEDYWDGSTYIYIHAGNNSILTRAVTGYDPENNEIQFTSLGTTWYSSYAMVNSLKILDTAGEYVVREDQTGPGGGPKIYLWPLTAGVSGKEITVSVRDGCFTFNDESYVTVRGFKMQKSDGDKAVLYNTLGQSVTDILAQDNVVTMSPGSGINLDSATSCVVEDNEVIECKSRGIILTHMTDTSINDNYLEKNGGTGIDYYYAEDSQIVGNVVVGHLGRHANGITCYLSCDNVLIMGNFVFGGRIACTVQTSTNMTYAYNVFHGNDSTYAFADWGTCENLYLYNNVIQSGGTTIGSTSVGSSMVAKNNIMDGSSVQYRGGTSEYNIYTSLSWTQDPNNLGTGEFQDDAADLWVDPDNLDYHLKTGSTAIDAGVDVNLDYDIEGTSVPQGDDPDIGAYEYEQ